MFKYAIYLLAAAHLLSLLTRLLLEDDQLWRRAWDAAAASTKAILSARAMLRFD
jgi:hypothetical protein